MEEKFEDMIPTEICTACMVCGEIIPVYDSSPFFNPKICSKCKDAILFVRQIMSNEGILVKDLHGCYQVLKYTRANEGEEW